MDFGDFERHARRAFQEIPDVYREGVDGLTVSRDAPEHPTLPGVYTLGHCLTEEHLSDYGSPDTTRSVIALYWGSFSALSAENTDFDWEGEIWETLTHELRHHLESLAGDDALEGVDYSADESFKRFEGQDFDPWYYEHGEDLGDGVFKVEDAYLFEQLWSGRDYAAADTLDLVWRGTRYRVAKPAEMGDVHFVLVEDLGDGPETVEVVVVRRRSWWEDVKRVMGTTRAIILESTAEAEPVEDGG